MNIGVSDDFADAARALDRRGFQKVAGRWTEWSIKRAGNAVRRHVRQQARPHRRTGKLSDQIRIRHTGRGLDHQTSVKAAGRVAHLIAGGVTAHRIEPGKIMALHGPGKSGPIIGFASVVEHPGFPADPFFARGVRLADRDVDIQFDAAAEKMAEELAFRIKRGR